MVDFRLAMRSLDDMGVPVLHVSTMCPDLFGTTHAYDCSEVRCRGNLELVASSKLLSDCMPSWSCSRGITPMCAGHMYERDITQFFGLAVKILNRHKQSAAAFRTDMAEEDDRGPIDYVDRFDGDPAAGEAAAGAEIPRGTGSHTPNPPRRAEHHRLHASRRSASLRGGS